VGNLRGLCGADLRDSLRAFLALRHSHAADLPDTHTIYFGGRRSSCRSKFLRTIAVIGALVISLVTGFAMEAQWPTLALYWYAPPLLQSPTPSSAARSAFISSRCRRGNDRGMAADAGGDCVHSCRVFPHRRGRRACTGGRFGGAASLPWRGVSIAAGFLLFTLAIREYVGRFDLLFEQHTIFDGVTYTDAHVTLVGMLFISVALAFGAVIAIAGGVIQPRARWLLAAIAPAVFCYIVAGLAGWYVSTFIVKPNQLDRERPYIADNIAMTRQAYGLDRFAQREFPPKPRSPLPIPSTIRPRSTTSACGM
jgi:uncharacterized protein